MKAKQYGSYVPPPGTKYENIAKYDDNTSKMVEDNSWKKLICENFDFNNSDHLKQLGQDLIEFIKFTLDTMDPRLWSHLARDVRNESDRDKYVVEISETLMSYSADQIKYFLNSYD